MWLKKIAGRDFDCFNGHARGEKPKKFATHHIGQYSARFDLEDFGMEGAKALAVEFCHKMSYFYRIFFRQWW